MYIYIANEYVITLKKNTVEEIMSQQFGFKIIDETRDPFTEENKTKMN